MTAVEVGVRPAGVSVEVPVVLGLPAEVAAVVPDHVLAEVDAEINRLAAELGLPMRARVTAAANPTAAFTIHVQGRRCPSPVHDLALAYRASAGWSVPTHREPVAWLVEGLRAEPTSAVVTRWFRLWSRAVLSVSPEVLVTEPVVAAYQESFRQHGGTVAGRLAASDEDTALVIRTVVGRRVAVAMDAVLEALDSYADDEPRAGDPMTIGEWLIYRLRPESVILRLAPDVPRALLAGIALGGPAPFAEARREFSRRWGLPAPRIQVTVDPSVPAGRFDVAINSVRTVEMPILPPGRAWVPGPGRGLSGDPVVSPFTGEVAVLVEAGSVVADGRPALGALDWVQLWLRACLWRAASCVVEKWTMDQCLFILDDRFPTLNTALRQWTELGPAVIGLTRLVHQFILEGQPVTNLRRLLDHLVDRIAGPCDGDPFASARTALSPCIGARVETESASRPVVRLGTTLEADVGLAAGGWEPALPPVDDRTDALIADLRHALGDRQSDEPDPVVLCRSEPAIVARVLRAEFPDAIVARIADLPHPVRERMLGPDQLAGNETVLLRD